MEGDAVVHDAPRARIRELHALEGHRGRERCLLGGGRALGDHRPRAQNVEDAARGGGPEHAGVEQHAQLAERPEHLDAEHQNDQQGGEVHRAGAHAPRPQGERGHRADRHAGVGDPAAHRVGAKEPHGALEEIVALFLEQPRALAALAERFQRREALEGVEQLGAKRRVGAAARVAGGAIPPVPQGGRDERDERGAHQHNGHWQVDERDEREDEDRGGYRDDELRQELAEVHLELLDAFHHRRRDGPGALMREVRGPEAHEVVVEPLAESRLHAERGVVRDHRARVFDERPRGDHGDDGGDREQERRQPGAGEHAREEPTEQREPCNAEHDADEPEGRGHDDARPQAGREAEEFAIEVHLRASAAIPGSARGSPPSRPASGS